MRYPFLNKFLFAAACVLAGWIAAFSMAPTSFWPCLFVGLSALYWLYSKTHSAGGAFAAGFFFALGYFTTGLWWIGNALLVEGNDFAWVWPISVIGLPTLLAFFTGVYLSMARMAAAPDSVKGFIAFAFFLTFSEWARGNAFTGFPWNLYGYVWADYLPMAQTFHLIGAYGYTFVSVFWAALAGFLLIGTQTMRVKIALAAVATLSLSAAFSYGQIRLDSNPGEFDTKNAVVVIQPNIAQNMKWDPEAVQDNFRKLASLTRGGVFTDTQPDNIFIIWPETAISPSVYSVAENMDAIRDILQANTHSQTYLITGVLRRLGGEGRDAKFANSVVFLNKDMTALQAYDKYHLVPFGEFIPLQKYIPLKPVAAFRGFERGQGPVTIQREGAPSFSPLICYEVIFPDDVISKTQPRPDWIVNVTNDGWYGTSAGPYQHFAQTRLRAIEEGLPVVRAANTGISGIIDPYGRVVDSADIFQEATLVSHLPKPLAPTLLPFRLILQAILPALAMIWILSLLLPRRISP